MASENKDEVAIFLEEKCGIEDKEIQELKATINVYLRGKGTSLQRLSDATSSYTSLKKIVGGWTKDPEKIGKIAAAIHNPENLRPRSPLPTKQKIPTCITLLAKKINHNPASISKLTLEELQAASSFDSKLLAQVLNRTIEKTIAIQELCRSEIERRLDRNALEKRVTGFSSRHLSFPK